MITENQLKRTQQDYSRMVGEQVIVEEIGGAMYVFGSELATLRLFRKMPHILQGYSENRKTFYVRIDMPYTY
jgi:hypothetical protein